MYEALTNLIFQVLLVIIAITLLSIKNYLYSILEELRKR